MKLPYLSVGSLVCFVLSYSLFLHTSPVAYYENTRSTMLALAGRRPGCHGGQCRRSGPHQNQIQARCDHRVHRASRRKRLHFQPRRPLRQLLVRRQPAALFTTNTTRTRATLAPLAEALKVEPQEYDPRRGRDLADRILKEYPGKTVVIVGHSNTVLSLIDDFGLVPPVDEIGENDYEYLFTVRLVEGMMPTVDMRGYGAERPRASAKTKAAPAAMIPAAPVK